MWNGIDKNSALEPYKRTTIHLLHCELKDDSEA